MRTRMQINLLTAEVQSMLSSLDSVLHSKQIFIEMQTCIKICSCYNHMIYGLDHIINLPGHDSNALSNATLTPSLTVS